jgi:hypothetical protein
MNYLLANPQTPVHIPDGFNNIAVIGLRAPHSFIVFVVKIVEEGKLYLCIQSRDCPFTLSFLEWEAVACVYVCSGSRKIGRENSCRRVSWLQ